MTDIQEQALPTAGTTDKSAPAGKAAGAASGRSGATRPAAKRGSLNTMLLPELQQVAGGLGIRTTKMKKSDLVAAIQAARASGAPASTAPASAAPASSAPASTAPASAGAASTASTAPARTSGSARRPATDTATATDSGDSPAAARTAPAAAEKVAAENGAAPASERRRTRVHQQRGTAAGAADVTADSAPAANADVRHDENRQSSNGNRQSSQGSQGNQGNGNRQNNQSGGDRQNNHDGNRQNTSNTQGGQNPQGGQNTQGSQNTQNSQNDDDGNRQNTQNDDDDFEGGARRRGRRYRDRRGRTRDRQGGSATDVRETRGSTESEPTVFEDDVLVPVGGVVDCVEDKNNWFVRVGGYFATPEDVFIGNVMVRRYGLRRGDAVTGVVRQPREGERREKYNPLVRLDSVNGREPDAAKNRPEFTKLTPLYPNERLRLETEPHILTTRVIDLVMPIGKGQRALIVSPPKAGKTMVLQAIANAIAVNNPEAHLMVVLVDERPEEVTDMQRSVKGEVIASTFDRRPQDHITVAELSIERAKRLVEVGHDVVVLLDSITRLGRAYNLGAPASGRILSGGVDSTALYQPKRFLGAARNIENGGSLTIIATALVETGSAGDTVFFEEYKGTGNAELKLDRKIADKRIFPAIDVDQSSTRKEEILLSPDELAVTIKLRRVLHALDSQQAIELLLDRLRKTRTNVEFLMNIAKTTPTNE